MRVTPSFATLAWCIAVLAFCFAPPAPAQHSPTAGSPARTEFSSSLTLTVDGSSLQLSSGDLAAMPQTAVTVHNEHTSTDETYTGVAVSDLLTLAGLKPAHDRMRQLLHSYLRAQGSDFYFVLYSGTEIDPSLHAGSVVVALKRNGQSLGQDGRFKLVSSEDRKPARWVRNLISLSLVTLN